MPEVCIHEHHAVPGDGEAERQVDGTDGLALPGLAAGDEDGLDPAAFIVQVEVLEAGTQDPEGFQQDRIPGKTDCALRISCTKQPAERATHTGHDGQHRHFGIALDGLDVADALVRVLEQERQAQADDGPHA